MIRIATDLRASCSWKDPTCWTRGGYWSEKAEDLSLHEVLDLQTDDLRVHEFKDCSSNKPVERMIETVIWVESRHSWLRAFEDYPCLHDQWLVQSVISERLYDARNSAHEFT